MEKSFFDKAEKLNKEHQRKNRWQKVITVMAAVVVFCTTYALILPAITWERKPVCEMKAHTHSAACYTEIEVTPERRDLVCLTPEHVHGDSCYEEVVSYVCGLEEDETHQHTKDCMHTERVLVCDQNEHTHDDACYDVTPAVTQRQLTCGMKEHTHTDACYDAPRSVDKTYHCGYVAHKHSKDCYFEDGSLRCTLTEHEHTLACKNNPDADVETAADWEATFANVKLGKNWPKNVLKIADSQLGYTESGDNFQLTATGESNGYTRYGAWYGVPYGDWCAMFASFCIDYAGVKDFPLDSNCGTWIEALSDEEMARYHFAHNELESYMPQPGDLIFFDWDAEESQIEEPIDIDKLTNEELADVVKEALDKSVEDVDHVGIVYEIIEATEDTPVQVKVIEGNNGNVVAYHTYDLDDVKILGYGALPQNPDYLKVHKIESAPASDGAIVTISGNLPVDAKAVIKTVKLSEKQLNAYVGEDKASGINSYIAYDIKIMSEDEEWQPIEPVSVTIKNPNLEVKSGEGLAAAHVDDETQTASEVNKPIDKNDTIAFTADGFSTYIFYTFTVDFHYGEVTFSIAGRTEIALSELFKELGITRSVADVVDVTFSDESLVSVKQTENDWLLTSLEPFSSDETLTITFNDGEVYVLGVTDAQDDPSYWQKVTETSDITTDDQYMIVSSDGKYAYGMSGNNFVSTPVTFVPVTGQTYCTLTGDTNTNNYRWTFGKAGTGGTITNIGGNRNLKQDTLKQSDGSWLIFRSYRDGFGIWAKTVTEYLVCDNNGNFGTSESITNANLTIYKLVERHADDAQTIKSGWGTGTKYTVPVYLQQVDIYGNALPDGTREIGPQTVDASVTSNKPIQPAKLFENSGESGQFVNAYYGTESTCDKDNVTAIYRHTANNEYYLGLVSDGTAYNQYLNADSPCALYLQYYVNSGGSTSGGTNTKPSYPDYIDPSGAKTDETTCEGVDGMYYSDPATSQLESLFPGVEADDGKIMTDKSVIYGHDDYNAFDSYDPNTFGVTLSALGQAYKIAADVEGPIDVVFVVDVSGSMIASKYNNNTNAATETVKALNKAMRMVMDANPDNRMGVVCFSNYSKRILDLGRYEATNDKYFPDSYSDYDSNTDDFQPSSSIRRTDGGTLNTGAYTAGWYGTYTQSGIAEGAKELIEEKNTTVDVDIKIDAGDGQKITRTVTMQRRPVIILLSDGDPTFCNEHYDAVLENNASIHGDGGGGYQTGGKYKTNKDYPPNYSNKSREGYPQYDVNNNKGINGYYTILSANYYKNEITKHYGDDTYFYSIGLGMTEGSKDSISQSVTSDIYKTAVLNPTPENIAALATTSGKVTASGTVDKDISGHTLETSTMLRQLLNNTISTSNNKWVREVNGQKVVYIDEQPTALAQSYGSPNATTGTVPVINNPYVNSYQYTDGASFTNKPTATELAAIYQKAIGGASKTSVYGMIFDKDPTTNMTVSDTIGAGMEIKSDPILRYGGKNYAPTSSETVGNVTTYHYSGTYRAADGSGRTADLSDITAQVITDDNGNQTVKLIIPDALVPTYLPNLDSKGDANFYYESLPARLIYQVGLTAESQADIAALKDTGGKRVYYTNAWEGSDYAYGSFVPAPGNPYYKSDYDKTPKDKTENTTETVTTSREFLDTPNTTVKQKLGNNGKLEFYVEPKTTDITLKKVNMPYDQPITNNPATFELYSDQALTQKVCDENGKDSYTTDDDDGKVTIKNLEVGKPYYLKEIKSPNGYNCLPEVKQFTINANGTVEFAAGEKYLEWENGELLVRNSDGYELPMSGGIGTILYTSCGLLLVVSAMYGYSMRRKRERGIK